MGVMIVMIQGLLSTISNFFSIFFSSKKLKQFLFFSLIFFFLIFKYFSKKKSPNYFLKFMTDLFGKTPLCCGGVTLLGLLLSSCSRVHTSHLTAWAASQWTPAYPPLAPPAHSSLDRWRQSGRGPQPPPRLTRRWLARCWLQR